MNTIPHRQRGIALLVALLVVALAAVLIAGLLDRGELALARTRNVLRGEQADAYSQALEAYAAQILLKDDDDDKESDFNTDIWAAPLPPQQVPGGTIFASMRDLNGCFNLNNLASDVDVDTRWMKMFDRLLIARGVDTQIASAIREWLGGNGSGADVVDGYYLAQQVPYRSAQRRFAHVSELRLVRGVTSEVYAELAPYVCALPPPTPINVNTASVPVLQTLGDAITKADAESLWQNGQAHLLDNFWTDWSNIPFDLIDVGSIRVGIKSRYFLARGDVNLDGVPFTFYSLIDRSPGLGIRVLERSRGSDDALVAPALPDADRNGSR